MPSSDSPFTLANRTPPQVLIAVYVPSATTRRWTRRHGGLAEVMGSGCQCVQEGRAGGRASTSEPASPTFGVRCLDAHHHRNYDLSPSFDGPLLTRPGSRVVAFDRPALQKYGQRPGGYRMPTRADARTSTSSSPRTMSPRRRADWSPRLPAFLL